MRRLSKIILLLIAAAILFPVVALAQPAAPRPACYHLVNGYPFALPRYEWGEMGWHLYWACSDIKSAPATWYAISCLHGACSLKTMASAVHQITRSSAKVSTANALWDQYIGFDCAVVRSEQTPRGALCRERRAILISKHQGWQP